MYRSRPVPFVIFLGVCSLLSLCFLLLWGINLNIALGGGGEPGPSFSWVPPGILAQAVRWSADMSTVSTLIPFLITLFPAWIGIRTCRLLSREQMPPMLWRPYPPHFAFFLIMLGLVGTLYGLLIGLESSGVEAVAGEMSAGAVRTAVDRLMSGTATAVLSSLVGIVGAFVAARPMAWLYCQLLPAVAQEEVEDSLEDTVLRLTEGLGRMDHAVRNLTGSLQPVPLQALLESMADLKQAQHQLGDQVQLLTEQLAKPGPADALVELIPLQKSLLDRVHESTAVQQQTVQLLERLAVLSEQGVQAQGEAALSRQQLMGLTEQQVQQAEQLTAAVQRLGSSQEEAARGNQQSMLELVELLREQDASRAKDRQTMRKSLLSLLADAESDG